MKTLTIISRKSHLAQIQAEAVGKRILKYFPKIEIKFIQKDTQGDIDLNTPLHKMPEIGVFTNDIRNELIQKNADLAVHSWKDLPVEMEDGTKISATIERAGLRDRLIFKKNSISKKNISIYTIGGRVRHGGEAAGGERDVRRLLQPQAAREGAHRASRRRRSRRINQANLQ